MEGMLDTDISNTWMSVSKALLQAGQTPVSFTDQGSSLGLGKKQIVPEVDWEFKRQRM